LEGASFEFKPLPKPIVGFQGEADQELQSLVRIEDPHVVATIGKTHHADVKFNGNEDNRVPDMVFEITDAELATVDEYEAAFLNKRVAAMLALGRQVWVYVHAHLAPDGIKASLFPAQGGSKYPAHVLTQPSPQLLMLEGRFTF
jgi:hypothetical protein